MGGVAKKKSKETLSRLFLNIININQTMKASIVLAETLEASRIARQTFQGADVTRRYFQLTEMMKHHNMDFDERKYWSYGCNCLILGDRPMSDPGHGPPIDSLDTVCKAYKDCVK